MFGMDKPYGISNNIQVVGAVHTMSWKQHTSSYPGTSFTDMI